MEALVEIFFAFLWGLLNFLFELALQGLAETAFHGLAKGAHRFAHWRTPAWISALAHAGFGAVAGWLSLRIAPQLYLGSTELQILNLVASPLAIGWLTALIRDRLRNESDDAAWRQDFTNAALLAFSLAAIRLYGAR